MSHARRVALFGGTFDPVHKGHLMMASEAVEILKLDEVRFLPCRISPHKSDRPPTDGRHRLEMLKLAIEGLPWAVADDYDLLAPEPSFAIRTIEEMKRREPDARFYWLMGWDQWQALPRWRDPERLAEAIEFAVFSRGEDPEPRAGWRLHPLRGLHPASSTAIRAALAAGESTVDWLPQQVLSYILEHQLYVD